jgi:hypothetical protein
MDKPNYIYLLKEREFVNSKMSIYKVGKSKQENTKRFKQYPKGSILCYQRICNDCDKMEKEIIKKFKIEFNQAKDIGNEYFEGDVNKMINIISKTIKNEELKDLDKNFGIIKRNDKLEILNMSDFTEQILINTSKKMEEYYNNYLKNNTLDPETANSLKEVFKFQNGKEHYKDLSKEQMNELDCKLCSLNFVNIKDLRKHFKLNKDCGECDININEYFPDECDF